MFLFIKYCFFLCLTTINLFANLNFTNPNNTPVAPIPQPLPDLSALSNANHNPQIATDSSGKYVYAIWTRYNGSHFIIQTSYSNDYGSTWNNPTQTPVTPAQNSPDLSDSSGTSNEPQIATDHSGKYVFAIWSFYNYDDAVYEIQTAHSKDFGQTWTYPNSTPLTSPYLSDPSGNSDVPQIAVDSSGLNVFAIWEINIGGKYVIQTAHSMNNGDDWLYPTTTPYVSPNLTDPLGDAKIPQITTDSTGTYVNAIWKMYDGSNNIIQTAYSNDSGADWVAPSNPDLSATGADADAPQIITDSSGQNVYAIWQRYVEPALLIQNIQVTYSNDNGQTWNPPINLSQSDFNARDPQITTDATGEFVYAIWSKNNGSIYRIQTSSSSNSGQIWSNPIDISANDFVAENPQIATNESGKYVYAIWDKNDGSNYIVQTSFSDDNGITWKSPTSTPIGTPNLSPSGVDAYNAQITTNSNGKYVYAIWKKQDSFGLVIQTMRGLQSLVNFPVIFTEYCP